MSYNKGMKNFLFIALTLAILTAVIISCDGSGGDGEDVPTDGNSGPLPGAGSVQGSVLSSNGFPLNAVHVRAVNVNDTDLQISAFSGIGPDLTFRDGEFRIDGVPSGTYRILIEKLDGRSLAFQDFRYSDFVEQNSPSISFPDEYFNGVEESSDDNPQDSVEITVINGQTTGGINIVTND